jgi:hypothetical protein
VIGDFAVSELQPVNMIGLEVFSGRRNPYQHTSVYRDFSDAAVRATHFAPHNNRVVFRDDLDDLDVPVGKRREDVVQYHSEAFAPNRPTEIFRVSG